MLRPDEAADGETERELEELMTQMQPGWRDQLAFNSSSPTWSSPTPEATAAIGGVGGRPVRRLAAYDNVAIAGDWVGPRGQLSDACAASAADAVGCAASPRNLRPRGGDRGWAGDGGSRHGSRAMTVPLASAYTEHRPFLWSLCYRMLGSAADAEDVVQDTFVARDRATAPSALTCQIRPWLVKVALNRSRDVLRHRRSRSYVGPWLPPSPIDTGDEAARRPRTNRPSTAFATLEGRYDLLESVSFAFLLALEAPHAHTARRAAASRRLRLLR